MNGSTVDKVGLWVQRYDGGITERPVIVTHVIVAVYDERWGFEQAWGTFVKHRTVPHCEGWFSTKKRRLDVWLNGSMLAPIDIRTIVAGAFRENEDEARILGNPVLFIDNISYGTVRELR